MIFYSSGTGNSWWVANRLAEELNERVTSITSILNGNEQQFSYEANETEEVILLFPVHSWGPPELINRFVRQLTLTGKKSVWAVATCGDECGMTDRILKRELASRGIELKGCFSVVMPNNYILMRGFGTDSKALEQRKLSEAPERIARIAEAIRNRVPDASLYDTGTFRRVKSQLIYPLFIRYSIGSSAFHATDKCVGCGICQKLCPTRNITMIHKEPIWSKDCVQCTACIHRCPFRAIEYGNVTRKMGRYVHPELPASYK